MTQTMIATDSVSEKNRQFLDVALAAYLWVHAY